MTNSDQRHDGHGETRMPYWDDDLRELRYGDAVVKRYKRNAENQFIILRVFQEENWRHRISDPIPGDEGIDPKRRLNETIRRLNACHLDHLIAFSADGTGEGIQWRPVKKGRRRHKP